jgi:hypothetical protein
MSIAINGKAEEIYGVRTLSYLDKGGPPHTKRVNKRKLAPTGIVLHAIIGDPDAHVILDASGNPAVSKSDASASGLARRTEKILPKRADGKVPGMASEHLIVSGTGTVYCIADLATEITWHAKGCNPHTIGIEICSAPDGGQVWLPRKAKHVPRQGVHLAAYESTVRIVHWICERFDIPKRIPARSGKLITKQVKRLNQDNGGPAGKDFGGVWAHYHSTANRGLYDPGLVIQEMLLESGFVGVDPDV